MGYRFQVLFTVVLLAGCSLSICETDEECKDGRLCDLESKTCYEPQVIVCDKDCGEGFFCQTLGGADVCTVKDDERGTVALRSPAPGSVSKAEKIQVSCEARAPQFGDLLLTVKSPAGDVAELPGVTRRPGTDLFDATFDAEPESVTDGEYEFGCKLSYGPTEAVLETMATPVKILIDRAAPTITIEALDGWHARSSTATVTATIVDEGGTATKRAGVDADSVKLVASGKTFPGAKSTGDKWTFAVVLEDVTNESIEGELEFEVHASDVAGNSAVANGTMKVDATPPSVSMTVDSTWMSRTDEPFTVTATAESTGAPVAGARLTGGVDGPSIVGELKNDKYEFLIEPLAWQKSGEETPAAWTLIATDEAGNEGILSGVFNIDGKGPRLDADVAQWVGGPADSHSLAVTISDAGSGVDKSSVTWSAAGQTGECSDGAQAGEFTCLVSIASLDEKTEPNYEVTLFAKDQTRNETSKSVGLKVDRQGPTISFEPDEKWYGGNQTVTVEATVTDAGVGVGGTPTLTVSSPKTKTIQGQFNEFGRAWFEVSASDVADAGWTGWISGTFKMADALGNETESQATQLFKVDRQPPTISAVSVTYPEGRSNILRREVATGKNRSRATISATIKDVDDGSGVSEAKLAFVGLDGQTQEISSDSTTSAGDSVFTFDAALAEFKNGEGTISVDVVAIDEAGNKATESIDIEVTRKLWEHQGSLSSVNGGIALSDGRVYYVTANNGADSASDNVFSVNSTDGSLDWSTKVLATPTTPVTVGDTYFYFGSNMDDGTLHAFPLDQAPGEPKEPWSCSGYGVANGGLAYAKKVQWNKEESQTIFYPVKTRILAIRRNLEMNTCVDENIIVGGAIPGGGVGDMVVGESMVSHADDVIFVGSTDGRVAKLEINGGRYFFPSPATISPLPAGFGFNIPGVALDSSGQPIYVHPNFVSKLGQNMSPTQTRTSLKFASPTPAPASLGTDSRVYFGTKNGYLFGTDLSANTTEMTFEVEERISSSDAVATTPAIGQRDDGTETLYFGANDGKFRALSTAGTEEWAFSVGGNPESSPALDCDGVAYFGTANGRVYALITDSTDGLADSSWPKFQHDNRNTGSLTTSIHDAQGCVR